MNRLLMLVGIVAVVASACSGDSDDVTAAPVTTAAQTTTVAPCTTAAPTTATVAPTTAAPTTTVAPTTTATPEEPVVTLGDGVCEYDGPTDFDRGTLVSFRIINESSELGGFAILQLVGDSTFDEFAQVVSEASADELPISEYATVHTHLGGLAPGSETKQSVGFTATGSFGVVCLADPLIELTTRVIAGALVEVNE